MAGALSHGAMPDSVSPHAPCHANGAISSPSVPGRLQRLEDDDGAGISGRYRSASASLHADRGHPHSPCTWSAACRRRTRSADARDRGVSPHHRRMTATSPPPTCVTSATSQTSQETSGLARLASRLLTPGRFRRIMAATPTVSVGIRRPFGSLAADPGQVQGRLRVGLRPHEPRAVGERGGGDDRPSAASSRS